MRDLLKRWRTRRGTEPSPPRRLVFGDSHTVALAQAIAFRTENPQPELPEIELHRLRKLKGMTWLGDTYLDEFCQKIGGLTESDLVFSAIGGNQYAVVSTVRTPPYFELAKSMGAPHKGNVGDTIIPFRALESLIASGVVNSDGPILQRIRSATRARVFHLTPPPPKQDNAFIKQFHEARFAAEGLGDLEPHSPELRLACWTMQRQALAALCAEIGVELLPPPPGTVGEEGFLKQAYYGKDVTHANRRYGELVLRQIAAVHRETGAVAR